MLKDERDHPRSCGKDSAPWWAWWLALGSPPLVRERHENGGGPMSTVGITPARAGKTKSRLPGRFLDRDHPRSCGKDMPRKAPKFFTAGSPPLVRERRVEIYRSNVTCRITPARAGKTVYCYLFYLLFQDHPRSCGKDSNGSLYLRHFSLAGIQNLFDFFAGYLSTKKHKARFVKI